MGYTDPEKRRLHNRTYYEKNKERDAASRNATRTRRRNAVKEFLKTIKDRPCQDCNQKFPYYVMDFHHRDPKEKDDHISRLVHRGYSVEKLQKEVDKCDVLCANCHRIREYG